MKQAHYVYFLAIFACIATAFNFKTLKAQYDYPSNYRAYYGTEDYNTQDYGEAELVVLEDDYDYSYSDYNDDYSYDKADIYLDYQTAYSTNIYSGQTVKISCKQYYEGNSKDYVYPKVAYYLSNDPYYDSADLYLGSSTSSLSSEENYNYEYLYAQMPYGLESGVKYLFFVGDYANDVYEYDEKNNVKYLKINLLDYDYEYIYNAYNYDYNSKETNGYNNGYAKTSQNTYHYSPYQKTYSTMEAYPNPVSLGEVFYMKFTLPDTYAEAVKLTVYDAEGKVVDTAYTKATEMGVNYYEYDTAKLPMGEYDYTLTTGDYLKKSKIVVEE